MGNQAFAFAFQQLLDLSYLWSTSTHLNVTNATLPSGAVPADEVRLLNDTRTVVRQCSLATFHDALTVSQSYHLVCGTFWAITLCMECRQATVWKLR